jgi:hypothetical protein
MKVNYPSTGNNDNPGHDNNPNHIFLQKFYYLHVKSFNFSKGSLKGVIAT